MSVRATEDLIRRLCSSDSAGRPAGQASGLPAESGKSASVRDLEQRLTRALGARVSIRDKGGNRGGRIEIRYANLDDLDRILESLQPG
jgi:ParB family chromosome partitioning protein